MQLSIQLPDDVAEAFINEVPEQERNNIITQLFSEYVDKRERQKKRKQLMDNPSPFVKKYRGSLSEKHLRSLNDDRINYLLDK